MRRLACGGLAFVALVSSAGCGIGRGAGSGDDGTEVERIEQIPVELSVKLRGDINATLSKRVLKSTFVVRRTKDETLANDQVMGVETVDPVAVDGMLIKTGIAVVPFKGDGKYTMKAGSPSDALKEEEESKRTGKPRQRSSVKVEWWRGTDIKGPTELFWRREKECKATVRDEGTRGHVVCPVVTDEARTKKFSFEFSWDVP